MSQRKVSIENYLYETDISIRRTLLLVPRGVRIKRFYCIKDQPLLTALCHFTKSHILPCIDESQTPGAQQSSVQQPQLPRHDNIETANDTMISTIMNTKITVYTLITLRICMISSAFVIHRNSSLTL